MNLFNMTLFKKEIFYKCPNSNQLPCINGHPRCYNFSEICVFRLNKHFNLIPCRIGSHIAECTKFECNAYFKCPEYYCIPWGYVCDSKWDCPDGYDETDCKSKEICRGMFNCKQSIICVHLQNICDGYSDCPLSDDEFLCALEGDHCFKECTCYQFAMMCSNTSINHHLLNHLPYICYQLSFLSDVVLSVLYNRLAMVVHLMHNSIQDICTIRYFPSSLSLLDLSDNIIRKLKSGCFFDLFNLRKIKLKRNFINKIEEKAFLNLHNLLELDISYNNLNTIPKGIFNNITYLILFVVKDNPLKEIATDMFYDVNITIILSNNFQVCCLAPINSLCMYSRKWYNVCGTLLVNLDLRVSLIIVSFIALFFNIITIKLHSEHSNNNSKSYFTQVRTLTFNNLSLVFYFITLWSSDIYYGNSFNTKLFNWKHSTICTIMSSVYLCYNLFQPFILILITLTRLMVIIYPMESKLKSTKVIMRIIVGGLSPIIAISVAFGITVHHQGSQGNSCSPFVDPSDMFWIIRVVTVVVTVVNILTIFSTAVLSIEMVKALQKSQNNMITTSISKIIKPVIKQMALFTLSQILCWIPSSIIFLTALFTGEISSFNDTLDNSAYCAHQCHCHSHYTYFIQDLNKSYSF